MISTQNAYSLIPNGRPKRGTCIWFTGLSSAGKSTIAQALLPMLASPLNAVILDGDQVRDILWSELGSGYADRHQKAVRLAFAASLVVRTGALAICIIISPYKKDREIARQMVEPYGSFYEVFVDTPVEVCEQRDTRGFYKKARSGLIELFTGISEPYERPDSPDCHLLTEKISPYENAQILLKFLEERL